MARDRIKGITIQIGGDTTKLSDAIGKLNREVSATQTQLKDVERLLKMDPTNTNLLAQRQRLLGEAVQETKDKLVTLKEAEKQVQQQMLEGKISQEQYEGLQREIAATEQQLKSLKKAAATSNETLGMLAGIGGKLENVGDKISSAGKKLMPATLGVVGLGTTAVKTASDFDSAMSQVSAVSGATGDEFTALREKAREMGAKTKFSASEAAEAMNYMAMAGWKTEEMLSGIEGIMNLAAASGEDLAATSDIVTDALTAFGLTAADSTHFADVLAAASSNANTNVSMMGETFKYVAPIAGALGYSAEDTAEAIGLMANAGIKSSQAGTSLRAIMAKLSGEIKIAGENIGEVTIQTSNADGSMRDFSDILADCRTAFAGLSESEAAASAETLVGKNAMSGFLALMNAAPEDIEKLSTAIDSCDGASERMANTMQDNLSGQTTILMSQLQELAISFGDLLMPIIRDVVTAIQSFVDKLNSMDEGSRKTILTIAGIVAAIGPLLLVLGKIIGSVGTIMRVVSSAVGFIIANPIALIIAAVVGLVALIVAYGDEIKGWLQNFDDWLQGIFAKDWTEVFGPVLGGALNDLLVIVRDLWDPIKEVFDGIIDIIKGVFTWDLERAWEGIKEIFSGAIDAIWGVCAGFLNSFLSLFYDVRDAITWLLNYIPGVNIDFGDRLLLDKNPKKIPLMANGGILSAGSAIVGEAGPELLTVNAGRAVVQPLNVNTGRIEGLLGSISGQLGNVAGQTGTGSPVIVRMELDGHVIGQAALDYSRRRDITYGD